MIKISPLIMTKFIPAAIYTYWSFVNDIRFLHIQVFMAWEVIVDWWHILWFYTLMFALWYRSFTSLHISDLVLVSSFTVLAVYSFVCLLMFLLGFLNFSSHARRASQYVSLKWFCCPGRANRRPIVAVRLTFLDWSCNVLSISRYCLDGLLSVFILTHMVLLNKWMISLSFYCHSQAIL